MACCAGPLIALVSSIGGRFDRLDDRAAPEGRMGAGVRTRPGRRLPRQPVLRPAKFVGQSGELRDLRFDLLEPMPHDGAHVALDVHAQVRLPRAHELAHLGQAQVQSLGPSQEGQSREIGLPVDPVTVRLADGRAKEPFSLIEPDSARRQSRPLRRLGDAYS